MRDFLYIAPSFARSECLDSIMSIRISAGGLCFCIKRGGEIKLLLSRAGRVSTEIEQLNLLKELLAECELTEVRFAEIRLFYSAKYKLLIPECEVNSKNEEVWLKTLCDDNSNEQYLLKESLSLCDAELYSYIPVSISQYLEPYGRVINKSIVHSFINNSITSIPRGNRGHWVFAEYSSGVLDVIVTKGKDLIFFNSYAVKRSEEALYYLLQIIRAHSLSEGVNAVFSGETVDKDELIYAMLKRYMPMFTMAANIELKGICSDENVEVMPLFVHLLD